MTDKDKRNVSHRIITIYGLKYWQGIRTHLHSMSDPSFTVLSIAKKQKELKCHFNIYDNGNSKILIIINIVV